MPPFRVALFIMVLPLIAAAESPSARTGSEIDGFTEAYRRLQVAAAEPGLVDVLEVREGDPVTIGQVLAHLDRDVQRANLEVARRTMDARGQQVLSRAELHAAETRLEKLKSLLERKHASQEEVDKAERDRDIAAARLQLAKETTSVQEAEYERVKTQLERRTVRSPIDGVVIEIRRNVGEYVLPTDPTVMTIVQLHPLRATFSVPADRIVGLATGKTVSLRLPSSRTPVSGTIEFVSPVTTPQSGTVTIKVRVPNPENRHRAGEKCEILLDTAPSSVSRSKEPAPR